MTKPKCAVNGVKSKGSMCSQIIVNGKLCGYDGDCEHKEGHKPNQYALGFKAGLDKAVDICLDFIFKELDAKVIFAISKVGVAIGTAPVPEVQHIEPCESVCARCGGIVTDPFIKQEWQDLTRDDVESLFWPWKAETEYEIPLFEYRVIAAVVIAKFKKLNSLDISQECVEKTRESNHDCGGGHHASCAES